jgi:hypothetical protein
MLIKHATSSCKRSIFKIFEFGRRHQVIVASVIKRAGNSSSKCMMCDSHLSCNPSSLQTIGSSLELEDLYFFFISCSSYVVINMMAIGGLHDR